MLSGLEFIVAAAAIVAGLVLYVLALRRRPAAGPAQLDNTSSGTILSTNFYALAIIALVFFGIAFLIDVVS